MDNRRIGKYILCGVCALIPAGLSTAASVKMSVGYAALAVLSMFLYVWLVPVCRKRENLWMLLVSGIALTPINLRISHLIIKYNLLFVSSHFIVDLLRGVFLALMIFSVEEVVLGVVTRLIWKRQYKFLPEV